MEERMETIWRRYSRNIHEYAIFHKQTFPFCDKKDEASKPELLVWRNDQFGSFDYFNMGEDIRAN